MSSDKSIHHLYQLNLCRVAGDWSQFQRTLSEMWVTHSIGCILTRQPPLDWQEQLEQLEQEPVLEQLEQEQLEPEPELEQLEPAQELEKHHKILHFIICVTVRHLL